MDGEKKIKNFLNAKYAKVTLKTQKRQETIHEINLFIDVFYPHWSSSSASFAKLSRLLRSKKKLLQINNPSNRSKATLRSSPPA